MARGKKLIVGNWKMNPPTVEEAKTIFSKIKRAAARLRHTEVVICPSDLHIVPLTKLSQRSKVVIGVQDVFWEDQGFFTGQISPAMARNAGARYAIVGHSEKRKLGETNEQVSLKLEVTVRDGLRAIVCVGEKARDREGLFFEELKNQILATLVHIPRGAFAHSVIVAYEPLWEIGRKDFQAMKVTDVHEISIFIRKVLNDAFGSEASRVPILYGGSVSSNNAAAIVHEGGIEGLLVGRQSLDAAAFSAILKQVDSPHGR